VTLALAFGAMFVFVFLKAFQQRNVAFDHYWWVMPTSLGMAATEVYVIARIAAGGWHWSLVLVIGVGAGLGALSAMLLHKRFVSKEKKDDRTHE
jgi:hypothetical protein